MYAIYTTPGFIIESRPKGEAGRLLSIFTRDMGLVRATAQGIRLEKSKLRYHAQEYSFGEFSFVRGKEYWRLTNASVDAGHMIGQIRSVDRQELVARIALVLRRLLHGEEAHAELFGHIQSAFDILNVSKSLTPEEMQMLESLIMFRLVRSLGYVGSVESLGRQVTEDSMTIELVRSVMGQRKTLNAHINKALRESQL